MDKQTLTGTITFIHHEKQYATIEYIANGKTKTINGNISVANGATLALSSTGSLVSTSV